jgi:hypothetical protein
VLRRVSGPKSDEIIGDWRNCIMRSFITRTLRQIYTQNVQVKADGYVARMGIRKILVGKPEEKRALGRHRRGWEDNTEMDLKK